MSPFLAHPSTGSIDLFQMMDDQNPDSAEAEKMVIAALMRCHSDLVIIEFLGSVVKGIDAVLSAPRPPQEEEEESSTVVIEEIGAPEQTKKKSVPTSTEAAPSSAEAAGK